MTSPIDDEDATVALTGLLAVLDDVTNRILADREVAIEHARRSLAMRDDTLIMVAHDLRGPLNIIEACAKQLERAVDDPVQRRHVDKIVRGVRHASRLVRDLIEAAEGASSISMTPAPIDVVQVVLTAIETQQLIASNASVVLAADVAPAVPAVMADDARLQEVLENLIGNAIKFSPGGGEVVVGVWAEREAGEVRVWVRDHGVGIAAEHLPRVFERFFQGDKSDRRGAGLGLAICRAIVEAHGGRIWCESELGLGTTVTFTVPTTDRELTRG